MFYDCYSLQSVPLFNTQNGTNFLNMFYNCFSLQSVPLFNTQNGTNFTQMFYICPSLDYLPAFNLTGAVGVGSLNSMLAASPNISSSSFSGIRTSIAFTGLTLGTQELITIFSGLAAVTGGQTVSIAGNWGITGLTAANSGIATGKGWTIA